jgi:light-regulated signal transduction histidine kinase (bacteriophytochrome)
VHREFDLSEASRIVALEAEVVMLRRQLAEQPALREEMEQFAYVASHDLKEPLRIVANYLGLLNRRYGTKLDSTAQEYLKITLDATVRMRQLIDNLLEFSKAQSLDAEEQDLRCAVDIAIQNLSQLLADNYTRVEIGELPRVVIDVMQMASLFQNLIANALKYRREDAVHVQIRARREKDCWQIEVHDNGMGIALEHQQKVFQIFSRLHARDQIEGTGIGLATCRRIIERHGGTIGVESEPGVGSCFFFTLPTTPES